MDISEWKRKQLESVVNNFKEKWGKPTAEDIYELASFWKVSDDTIRNMFEVDSNGN